MGSSGRKKQICGGQLCYIPSKTGQKNSFTFVAEAPRPHSFREALLPLVWCSCSVYMSSVYMVYIAVALLEVTAQHLKYLERLSVPHNYRL